MKGPFVLLSQGGSFLAPCESLTLTDPVHPEERRHLYGQTTEALVHLKLNDTLKKFLIALRTVIQSFKFVTESIFKFIQKELEMMFMKHYAPDNCLSLRIPKFTNINLSN